MAPGGWADRLVSVAQTLVVQWIRILLEFSEPGGVKPEASDNTLKVLLQHVPTPAAKKSLPPWRIETCSLSEWQTFFEDEDYRRPVSDSDTVLGAVQRDMEDLRHSSNNLPPQKVKQIADKEGRASKDSAQKLDDALSQLPRNPFEDTNAATDRTPPDPFTLPPATLYSAPITPTDYVFITGSTAMKVEIAIGLAEQEIMGWGLLATHCQNQSTIWNQRLVDLKIQHDILKQSRTAGERIHAMLSKQAKKVDASQAEIDAARSNPAVARLLDNQARARQMRDAETEKSTKK